MPAIFQSILKSSKRKQKLYEIILKNWNFTNNENYKLRKQNRIVYTHSQIIHKERKLLLNKYTVSEFHFRSVNYTVVDKMLKNFE